MKNIELTIALIQSSLVWESPEENRTYFSKKIEEIPSNIDVIVLPEMFTTGFTMSPKNIEISEGQITKDWMAEEAKKECRYSRKHPIFEKGTYTNRLFFVHPEGKIEQYDKRHTFTLAGEDKVYQAGRKRLIVDYKGFKICPMICYDLRFPVWARNTEAYDILMYVANWPKPRIKAWDTLLKARAIENMTYCIGVNRIGTDESGYEYSGHSAVYDCLGDQIVYSEKDEILFAILRKEHIESTRQKLRFLEDRDKFTLEV
ncbi:nitrilase family protein [Maribacter halichondriae]|uniref:nitrilase family protein n=1 Tax=Maribacter halichondriae TaxID=2980554 RepID=UPI00235950E1|nr:nitrilase family protein [Maribacter sp. Hal144]